MYGAQGHAECHLSPLLYVRTVYQLHYLHRADNTKITVNQAGYPCVVI
jgi:hypothetical protein